ncbi:MULTISPECIES: hypothetical protein [unclassified Methanobrevibacter]|jgi:hypothetical protein|uniref:hypothetical protein n=1 Tax=unclassified Methanobrevibacter TaxID=2638681 RepID=UPI002A165C61|nr:hypothetical protein [Methanobacteriaceae archaeon]
MDEENKIKDEDVNLEDYITFQKENGESLAVNIKYVGIKQRQDHLLSMNFHTLPKFLKEIIDFFDDVGDVGNLAYNISNTGFVPVNFRGLSPVVREPSPDRDVIFSMSLLLDPVKNVPKDSYYDPTCGTCPFHHID